MLCETVVQTIVLIEFVVVDLLDFSVESVELSDFPINLAIEQVDFGYVDLLARCLELQSLQL
jgi:hypothetical protein